MFASQLHISINLVCLVIFIIQKTSPLVTKVFKKGYYISFVSKAQIFCNALTHSPVM